MLLKPRRERLKRIAGPPTSSRRSARRTKPKSPRRTPRSRRRRRKKTRSATRRLRMRRPVSSRPSRPTRLRWRKRRSKSDEGDVGRRLNAIVNESEKAPMTNRLQRLRRNESGMSYVFIGLSMMAFISASMLAIDVGMLMTARSQAQNSADAGALAGATALVYDSYTDRSAGGPAVTSAIRASQMNNVMAGQVSVGPADVEFLNSPTTGEPNRVRVSVRRTATRGNAVATMVARYFGTVTSDIGATAMAEASPANAMDCVKPFTIPDKWIEKQTPPWDSMNDTYDAYTKKGAPLANPDVYIPAYNEDGSVNANYTGYRMFGTPNDVGTMLTIRAGNDNNLGPSFYFSLAMTDDTGGSDYRWNIANCNTTHYHWGDGLVQEPGAMTGPTVQGIE